MPLSRHRILLALILLGNALAFAGVDLVSQALTAALCVALVWDLKRMPPFPREAGWLLGALGFLYFLQLVPLPQGLRALLQPGYVDVMPTGWAPLSLAPWVTLEMAAHTVLLLILALVASRMAGTRSGVPALMLLIAATGVFSAVLGLISEGADTSTVLFFRNNVQGGSPYGAFVNRNHFAQAMEISMPAAMVFLAFALRRLPHPGATRQKAAISVLGSMAALAVGLGALLRTGSRGGALFLCLALLITAPLWRRSIGGGKPWLRWSVLLIVALVAGGLASTRLPDLRERMATLFAVEGMQGNSRLDYWRATLASFKRAPIPGSGAGSYPFVIAMDKPATGTLVLEQAHNDYLEWLSTTGIIGAGIALLLVVSTLRRLRPGMVRSLRGDYRYPLAGAAVALAATALHEAIGFGLQTPLNRYMLVLWIGMIWGMTNRFQRNAAPREVAANDV